MSKPKIQLLSHMEPPPYHGSEKIGFKLIDNGEGKKATQPVLMSGDSVCFK
jgi:hypothetical protein